MSFGFIVALSMVAIPWASATSHRFLSRRQEGATSELALASARARLRASAFELASAVGEELLGKSSTWEIPKFVAAARDRLGEEADHLENSSEAKLLHEFAENAPSHVLIWPLVSPEPDWDLSKSFNNPNISSISTQIVTETNAQGETQTHTVRCENNQCTRSDQTGQSAEPALALKARASTEDSSASSESSDVAAETSIQAAERGMGDEMRNIEENFERSFDDALDDNKESVANVFSGDFFGDILNGGEVMTAAGSGAPDYTISQTVVKDGRVERTTQRCRNGKCETSTDEEDAEEPEMISKLHRVRDGGEASHQSSDMAGPSMMDSMRRMAKEMQSVEDWGFGSDFFDSAFDDFGESQGGLFDNGLGTSDETTAPSASDSSESQAPDTKHGKVEELENSLDNLRDELKRKREQAPILLSRVGQI